MSNREINHQYTQEIVCPWCGYEFGDSFDYEGGEEYIGLIECHECERHFYATRNVTVNYCTEKAKYGTCVNCGKNDVVLRDYHGIYGKYENLCLKCGEIERIKLIKEWAKENLR